MEVDDMDFLEAPWFNTLVNIVTVLGLFGVPSVFAMTVHCVKCCREYSARLRTIMEAQQVQMRTKLIEQYKQYKKQGYILDDDLQDWMDQYDKYHTLGANGVLDKRREDLINMPSFPPESED